MLTYCYNINWNLSPFLRVTVRQSEPIHLFEKSFGAFAVWEATRNSPTSGTKHSPSQSWANHLTWHFEGYNIRQEAFILRLLGQAVRAQRILILVQSRDSEGSGQPVCRVAHGLTGGELGHCGELGKEPQRIRYAITIRSPHLGLSGELDQDQGGRSFLWARHLREGLTN